MDSNYQADQVNNPPSRQRRSPDWILFTGFTCLSGIISIGSLISGVLTAQWQFFVLACAYALPLLAAILTRTNLIETTRQEKGIVFTFLTELAFIASACVITSQVAIAIAIVALIFAVLMGSIVVRGKFADRSILVGLIAAILAVALGNVLIVDQLTITTINLIVYIATVVFVLLFLLLLFFGYIETNLRFKLVMVSLLLTMVPLAILSVIENQFTQNAIQEQNQQSLRIAAEQTAGSLNKFFEENLDSVKNEASLPAIQRYISLPAAERVGSAEETELRATFESLQTKQNIYLPSYALLDMAGQNLFDTESSLIGISETNKDYFQSVLNTGQPYSSSVIFDPDSHDAYLYFSAPVTNAANQMIGVLRTRYDALLLQDIIQANVGLIGVHSYPILVDENNLRLADGYAPNLIYRTLVELDTDRYKSLSAADRLPSYLPRELSFTNQTDLASAINQENPEEFFTVTVAGDRENHIEAATTITLNHHPWKLVFIQETTGLIEARDSQNRLSTLIATVLAGVVGILITLVSNLITAPIAKLTTAAEKISAGDLTVEATVTSKDEIGVLGKAFNSMTHQLSHFIDTLESRVQERTEQLARQNAALTFRSKQLQTVSDVARNIVSNRDFESLLTDVTTLISDRFGFYHVGIFLLDAKGEYAVLRAANSKGGKKMLARQHHLKVGQVGIVGYTTGSGQPRIATDVGQDAVFFNNPDLPETRSEMALPLIVENRVIGALDVQSTESNAFTEEDVELFTTLAYQVAVAINNNQLYADTLTALDEMQNLHRRYLNQEWTKQASSGQTSYKYTAEGLTPFNENLPEIESVLESSRPILKTKRSAANEAIHESVLAVPILLRGETIGVIHLQENRDEDYAWSEKELSTAQSVADQVAQTLENARLFEQTIRRAERERKVLEITSKIRATNDPQQMLQITLEELRKNLGASDAQIIINVPGNGSNLQSDTTYPG